MPYSVIIADDEPLVLVGLKSMINWEKEDLEVIGQARNGKMLEELIDQSDPDIVISDIKMPLKSGLEVAEEERAKFKKLPVFIFLTSFEEFDYVKKAINLEAVDYLVKLELNEKILKESLNKAKTRIDQIKEEQGIYIPKNPKKNLSYHQDRFFIRELFSLNDENSDFKESAKALNLDLSYPYYSVSYLTIESLKLEKDKEKSATLFNSTIHLAEETVSRYFKCYIATIDISHIALILCFKEEEKEGYRNITYTAMRALRDSALAFFSLNIYISVGPLIDDFRLISTSFNKAKAIESREKESDPIIFYDHSQNRGYSGYKSYDFKTYKQLLKKAFDSMDAEAADEILEEIAYIIETGDIARHEALDIASSILNMAKDSLPESDAMIEKIFPSSLYSAGYKILFEARNNQEVASWIRTLSKGIREQLQERGIDYREKIIIKIERYIDENIYKKLTQKEVADLFGYSQGYLSSLFGKYAGISFVDYVTKSKIEKAKEMLKERDAKIYEVATLLSFESPFYFSKVFKKVTGISPSEYISQVQGKSND